MATSTSGAMVSFARPDGGTVSGYYAVPALDNAGPGIVLIQEWWGLNDQIRGVADRLAAVGYRVLVPDLYRGQSTTEEEEAHHLMGNLDFNDAVQQDIAGALAFLTSRTTSIGVTGFCMGGVLTLLALAAYPAFAAGVVWYGLPPADTLNVARLQAPILAHWALQDAFFPMAEVDALERRLQEHGATFSFHRYLAHHGFANETAVGPGRIPGTQYDPDWSRLAWDRTLTFFAKTLN